MRPIGHLQSQPIVVCLEAEVEQPLRLALLGRDEAHHLFVQAHRNHFRVHIGGETVFIFLLGKLTHKLIVRPLLRVLIFIVIFSLFHTILLGGTKLQLFIETCKREVCF